MDSYLKMMKHMADLYRKYEHQMVDVAAEHRRFCYVY